MPKIRLDPDTRYYDNAQRFAAEHGLQRLGQDKLKPMADAKGIVSRDELERLARVAHVDVDGKLTPDERKRIDAYLRERSAPIVASANSSSVDVRSSVRKPVDAYIEVSHEVDGKGLIFTLDVTGDTGRRDEYSKRIVLEGVKPNTRDDNDAIHVQRYGDKGENASVGYERQGGGAGYMVGIADKKKGAILVNLSAAGAIAGDRPDVRVLLSPAELAKNRAVKALAKKEGLDPTKLAVEVMQVSIHSDFIDTTRGANAPHTELHTLLLALELREVGSRKKARAVDMTTLVEGNVTKPLKKLVLDGLEAGVQARWGYIYPPSVKFEEEKPSSDPSSGVRDTDRGGGGGEARNRELRHIFNGGRGGGRE